MSNQDLGTMAQREYYSRPADEGYATLAEGIAAAELVKAESRERVYSARDLSVLADPAHGLLLQGPKGAARFNHHSLGTLCRAVGAPAAWHRELDPDIAAASLTWGLQNRIGNGVDLNLLVRQQPAETLPLLRCVASTTYGRAWDADLWTGVRELFGHDANWMIPPTWPGGRQGGAYLGEPDSFLFMVNGGSIVQNPTRPGPDGAIYRGIMTRNSEVGECSIWFAGFAFEWTCGNHYVGGITQVEEWRRRHVGKGAIRDSLRELARFARAFTQTAASQDENLIRLLADREIATTQAAIVAELVKLGIPAKTAAAAYETAERHEQNPRSYWGMAAGLTRYSQTATEGHQNERLELDQLAAAVLRRGQRVLAA